MKPPKRKKKRGGHQTPPPDRQCTAKKDDGERCPAWTIKGTDFCYYHTPGKAAAAGKKGAATTNSRRAEVDAACERLPLLTPKNQAKYLNALIEEEDSRKGKKDKRLIALLMDRLEKVTRGKDDDKELIFVFTDPELPEDPVSDLPPLPASSCPHCGETVNAPDIQPSEHPDADPAP